MEQKTKSVATANYRVVRKVHHYTALAREYRYRGEVFVVRASAIRAAPPASAGYGKQHTAEWEPVGDWCNSEGAAWANCLNHAADQGPYEVVKEGVL